MTCRKCGSTKINIVAGKKKCEHCGVEEKAPPSRFFKKRVVETGESTP